MDKNIEKKAVTHQPKSAMTVIRRFSLTLFVVALVGSLTFAILVLNLVINQPIASNVSTSTAKTTQFDLSTINRLTTLKTSSENPGNKTLPSSRNNPFFE